MDTKELLKKVRKIEIKTRRLSDHIFGGEYHSAFKGRGMTFSEVRQYAYGDDVRAIDWNVTARYNEPYIKVFEEERELTLLLMVDVSGSGMFGSGDRFKKELQTEIAATLAFSAMQNNDKIGLLMFSDQVESYIPPKKGRSHVLRIIRELLEFRPGSKKTNISEALYFTSNVLKKKSIVFLISDFLDQDYLTRLQVLGNRHDITGIRLYDPMEEDMPDLGLVAMEDSESGRIRYIPTQSQEVRRQLEKYYLSFADYFRRSFQRSGCGAIECRTDRNYVKTLLGYFKNRA